MSQKTREEQSNNSSQPGRQVKVSANAQNYSSHPEVHAMGWRVKIISVSKENHLEMLLGEGSYLKKLGFRQASCEDTQTILNYPLSTCHLWAPGRWTLLGKSHNMGHVHKHAGTFHLLSICFPGTLYIGHL